MADVATLVFDIDSSGAAGAAKALAGLNRYAASTASVMAKLEKQGRNSNGQFISQVEYVAQNEAEIRRLASSYNLTLSAQLKFAEAQKDVARAVQLGVISADRQADVLRELQIQYTASARQAGVFSGGFKNMTSHVQNAGYQIGDFAVQVASGQNAMMALSQQLPQLLGGFGAWGAAAGAVTAILGAAYMVWDRAEKKAGDLDETISSLTSSVRGFSEAVNSAASGSLSEQFGDMAGYARSTFDLMQRMEKLNFLRATQDAISQTNAQFSGMSDTLAAWDRYTKNISANEDRRRVELQVIAGLSDKILDTYGLTVNQANRVKTAMEGVNNATNELDKAKALEKLGEALIGAAEQGAKIPPEMLKVGQNAIWAAQRILEMMGAMRAASNISTVGLTDDRQENIQSNRTSTQEARELRINKIIEDRIKAYEKLKNPKKDKSAASSLKQAEKQFQSLRELLEKESVFQVAEWEKRQGQLQNALNKRLITMQKFQEMESQLKTYYFGTEFEKRQLEYDLSLEQLKKHLEAEQITRQQYDIKAGDLHSQKVTELGNQDANRYSNDLGNLAKHMGEMNTIAGGGYDSLLKAQRVFGAASALISTYTGAAEALKLPFPYNLAAAGKVIAAGLGFVNAIKGGGSGGSSASAASSAATRQEPSKTILVRLDGPDWATEMVDSVITQIQEQSKDGRYIIQRD